jgi:thiaminase (transcriptional activator TenA)
MTGSFAAALQAEHRDAWDAMIGHRFVREIIEGRIDPVVFRRYLVQEGAFVERAITIFAYALADAPTMAARRRLAGVLHHLAHDQVAYFERVLGRPVSELDDGPAPAAAAALGDALVGFAAHGGYESVLAAMLAAEWMYETWCGTALAAGIEDATIRDWVALHVGGAFEDQVAWLRAEVDRIGAAADHGRRRELSLIFRRTLLYEIDFHHAPYDAR